MPIIDIISGVKVYQGKDFAVLFGCPPEIIKHLMVKKLPFPDYIVLPDIFQSNGVLQNATEFPFYYFLFVQENFFKGKKLSILGKKKHVENNKELLRISLLGPTKEEFNQLGRNSYYEELYQEARALSVKDEQGNEIPVDQFVDFISFNNDYLETRHFNLQHLDHNVYKINDIIIELGFTEEEQLPPYDLNPDFVPTLPTKFGIDVLGGASGFTPTKPSSGLILNYNSDYMLIDCMPYLEYSLNARGISKQQIKSLFLTHIHDDHCNIFPLILFNNKIKFLSTKEIFWMACKKLALMTMHDIKEFQSFFDFVELKPYEESDYYGITIKPHYTVHSIPTIGATFKMFCAGKERSIIFVGDNKSLTDIKKMVDAGSVTKEKFNKIKRLYRDEYDLFFADGGMGILHGNPKDSLKSKAHRVIFLHLEKLPAEFDTTFTLATHGKRFIISEAADKAYLIKTMLILNHHYPGISEDWETTLLSNINLVKFNSGDVIMKQGESSNGMIYIILSGNVSVMHHDGKVLRELSIEETGDIIGDMAVINRVKIRSASVLARIPVTLCEIHESLFYAFLKAENRIDFIKEKWKIRGELEQNYPFSEFSDLVNLRIARVGTRKEIKKGYKIIREGQKGREFYIVLKGRFQVSRDDMEIGTIMPGGMFGEYGSLADRARNASIKADVNSIILQIDKDDIKRIINSTPALNFYVHQIMRERKELD